MSMAFVSGNFAVTNGVRLTMSGQYYMSYQTSLQCSSSDALPCAEIRMYSPHNENPIGDSTVVNLFGRIFAPSDGKAMIDGISMVPYPGDPANKEKYESSILDDTSVKIWAVGTVLNNAELWKDGSLRIFNLAVSDYIRDKTRHFQLSCLLDGTSGQWNKIQNPNPNSVVYVFGVMKDISDEGNIIVELQSIALNIGPGKSTSTNIQTPKKTNKKRKFPVALSLGSTATTSNVSMESASSVCNLPSEEAGNDLISKRLYHLWMACLQGFETKNLPAN
ncbi:hypothetical protein K439DRAFT_1544135 [Ramaria rubella]|nr:hypothetical protein K439DRAFT_1544135 [Ramaria rubella]